MSIFAGSLMNTGNLNDDNNSRLLTNTSSLRNVLYTRNIYNPNNEYPLKNEKNATKIVSSVNSIINVIAPFNSYNLENTIYGRLITDRTPLVDIGLLMLSKQFAFNASSHISQQTLPIINVSNLFDNNKNTKLFSKNVDYRITTKEEIGTFKNFLDKLQFWYPNKDNPFNNKSNNSDYIEHSGLGQLNLLYFSLNQNVFKFDKKFNTVFYNYADKAGIKLLSRKNLISNRKYYNFNDGKFYPSFNFELNDQYINNARNSYINSISDVESTTSEYLPTKDFISKFGNTIKENVLNKSFSQDKNDWISETSEFGNDENIENKIVWGRDGISLNSLENNETLRGNSLNEEKQINNRTDDLTPFNVRTGLLEYTRNLINSVSGNIGDLTRKAFVNGKNVEGFNGSALWNVPDNSLEEFKGRKGVRQHSAIDQYDRFTKAIRFNGNKVYGGNENSVNYNSVIPRIHPTIDQEGKIDNKNLMFSIENLAINVINSKNGYGIIDDEKGSPIPESEIGPNMGRLMWFPPYDININETSSAKFDSTVMIGRNEPMYNYMNSERSATITFKLLIDYPPQLKNYKGQNKQREIAEFFAFGGYSNEQIKSVENLEIKQNELKLEIEKIQGETKTSEPEIITKDTIFIVFPNDEPKQSSINSIIDRMYKDLQYEIKIGCKSSDGTSWGYNKNIYFITGLTETSENEWTLTDSYVKSDSFSQYTQAGIIDQFNNICTLNETLKDVYSNETNRTLYDIEIIGGASKLYTEMNPNDVEATKKYNIELGKRRAEAAYKLVDSRLQTLFGKNASGLGIKINYNNSTGDDNANVENATSKAIPEEDTKLERYASIKIFRNSNTPQPSQKDQLSIKDKEIVKIKQTEIEKIDEKIKKIKSDYLGDNIFSERGSTSESNGNGVGDTGILKGFQSVSGNYYYPTFHSQTPEDFHKRLTFLQQCTRQGSARRYNVKVDENGVLRARNSVFGRQPICILRIADFFHTKIIIENVNIDNSETTWDLNPENFGVQPMIASVTLQIKILGGQSLKGPVDALQNAVSFNYYANSTFTNDGMYKLPSDIADKQWSHIDRILTKKKEDNKHGTN